MLECHDFQGYVKLCTFSEVTHFSFLQYAHCERERRATINFSLTRVSVDGEKLLALQHAVHHARTAAVCGVVSVGRSNLHNGGACRRRTTKCQTREKQSE